MLLALWSPKGGSGTSVLAAATALALARRAPARLVDLAGDQPALLGLASDPERGAADWLDLGAGAPVEALDRLTVEVGPGLRLLPRGRATDPALAPLAAAEAGAALAVALRDGSPTVVDVGTAAAPAARAVLEVADHSVVVLRRCYLALRRAVHASATQRVDGVVVVEEQGRALGVDEIGDVLGLRVLAQIPWKPPIANAVDAGVLVGRPPEPLTRGAEALLAALGLVRRRAA